MVRKAIVIDNNDPDKKDRLKLKIIPELVDVSDKLLPWVLPAIGYGDGDSCNRSIPDIDSIVEVELTDTFEIRNMRWLCEIAVTDFIDYDRVTDSVDSIGDKVSNYEYPQPQEFQYFKDGSYTFRNTETGELVFCHNTGVYTIYDEDGNVRTYTKDKEFQVYNDKISMILKDNGDYLLENSSLTIEGKDTGDLEISNNTCNIKMGSASVTINDNFEVLI